MAFKLRNPFTARPVEEASPATSSGELEDLDTVGSGSEEQRYVGKSSPELMEREGPSDPGVDADEAARKSGSVVFKDRVGGGDTMKQGAAGAGEGEGKIIVKEIKPNLREAGGSGEPADDVDSDGAAAADAKVLLGGIKTSEESFRVAAGDVNSDGPAGVVQYNESDLQRETGGGMETDTVTRVAKVDGMTIKQREAGGGGGGGGAGDGSGDGGGGLPEPVDSNLNLSKSDISLGRNSGLNPRGTVGDISLKRTAGDGAADGGEPGGPSEMEKGAVKFFNEKKEMAHGAEDAQARGPVRLDPTPARAAGEDGGGAPDGGDGDGARSANAVGSTKGVIADGDAARSVDFTDPTRPSVSDADGDRGLAAARQTPKSDFGDRQAQAAGEDGGGAPEAAINTSHSGIKNLSDTEPTGDAPGGADALRHDTVKNSIGNIRRETGPSAPVEGKPTKDQVAGESDASAGGGASGADRISTKEPTKVEVPNANRTDAKTMCAACGAYLGGALHCPSCGADHDPERTADSDSAAGESDPGGEPSMARGPNAVNVKLAREADPGDPSGDNTDGDDIASRFRGRVGHGPGSFPASRVEVSDDGPGTPLEHIAVSDSGVVSKPPPKIKREADPGGSSNDDPEEADAAGGAATGQLTGSGMAAAKAAEEKPPRDLKDQRAADPAEDDSPPEAAIKYGMVSGQHRDDDMTRSSDAVAADDDSPEAATIGHEATHTVQQRAQAATPLAASLSDARAGAAASDGDAVPEDLRANWTSSNPGIATGKAAEEKDHGAQAATADDGGVTQQDDSQSSDARTGGWNIKEQKGARTGDTEGGHGGAAAGGEPSGDDSIHVSDDGGPQVATDGSVQSPRDAGSGMATGRSIPENSVESSVPDADAAALPDSNNNEGVLSTRAGGEADEPAGIAVSHDGSQRMSGKIALVRQEDADPGDASIAVSDDGGPQAASAGEQKNWLPGNFRPPGELRTAAADPGDASIAVPDDGGLQAAAAGEQKKWLPANFRTAAADPDDDGPSTLLDLSSVDESGAVAPIGDPDFDLLASAKALDPDSDADGIDVDPDTDAEAVEFEEALITD